MYKVLLCTCRTTVLLIKTFCFTAFPLLLSSWFAKGSLLLSVWAGLPMIWAWHIVFLPEYSHDKIDNDFQCYKTGDNCPQT